MDDDEMNRVMARSLELTEEQRRAELKAEGVDPERIKAQAQALHTDIQQAHQRRKERRTRMVGGLAFVALLLLVFFYGDWLKQYVGGNKQYAGADAGLIGPDSDRATELRTLALTECDKEHWEKCIDGLDQAQGIDPKSNDRPEVKDARARAAAALHPEEDYDPRVPGPHPRKTPLRDGGNNQP